MATHESGEASERTEERRSLNGFVRPYSPDGPVLIVCTECQGNDSRRPWCNNCGSTGVVRAETVHAWRHRHNPWPNGGTQL